MTSTAKSSTTDKVRALHDRLTAEVEALVTGEDWARFLSVAARFHSYSTGAGRYSNPPNACARTVIGGVGPGGTDGDGQATGRAA